MGKREREKEGRRGGIRMHLSRAFSLKWIQVLPFPTLMFIFVESLWPLDLCKLSISGNWKNVIINHQPQMLHYGAHTLSNRWSSSEAVYVLSRFCLIASAI